MSRPTVLLALVALAGCTSVPRGPSYAVPTAGADQLYNTPDDSQSPERTAMVTWYGLNETCRGSPEPQPLACGQRDAVEKELAKRGWCYAYADPTVFPFDYRWHRCEQERPE